MNLSLFEAARQHPHDEALVVAEQRLSYAELADRVAERVRELRRRTLGSSHTAPIALVCDASLGCFEWLYALLALGVPVLPLHPRLTAPERNALIRLAQVEHVLEPAHESAAAPQPGTHAALELSPVPDSALLCCMPSSGTCGTPKLVRLTHGALLASARADAANIGTLASDRALLCLPLSHVGGLSVVTRALLARRPVVVFAPAGGLLGSLSALAELITRERISLVSLVPAVLDRLLSGEPRWQPPESLRVVLLGGASCSAELYARAQQRGVPVLASYGLTESASQIVATRYGGPRAAALRGGVISSGFPLRGVELRVRDGLIELRGSMLCDGYLNGPAPFDREGWLVTEDRGELDAEHGLFVLGRASDLIISGGENIDPVEVEHALLSVPGVRAAYVFGIADASFGELVAAVLEHAEPAQLCAPDIRAALEQRLASFKQPRAWAAVSSLPRLPSGKLDRRAARALAEPLLQPLKGSAGSAS